MATCLHPFTLSLVIFLCIQTLAFMSQATVPPSQTFKFVNQGELGQYISEYLGDYRPLDIFTSPFQLCFYNQTPTAFTLSLRMGTRSSESLMRWVWEANRGNLVGENATFSLGTDGNLVLAHADGRVAWQSGTANKGVLGFKLLPTGNMVLHDSKGKFLWQSFDSPTDTLLVGQSFRVGAVTKLVSRASQNENVDGPYSLVMEPKGLAMYYKSNNSPKPLLYFSSSEWFSIGKGSNVENVTFTTEETESGALQLSLQFGVTTSAFGERKFLSRPKYNATLSYLRLEINGNINVYSYDNNAVKDAWELTYTLFLRNSDTTKECQLPGRCANFGLCEDSQCVACPSSNGLLLGWSKSCDTPKVSSCRIHDFHYYKLEGVDHVMTKYTRGDGPVKENECGLKCSKDCKCLGYFYHQETSRCWIAYDLKTMTRVANSTHLGYIKVPN